MVQKLLALVVLARYFGLHIEYCPFSYVGTQHINFQRVDSQARFARGDFGKIHTFTVLFCHSFSALGRADAFGAIRGDSQTLGIVPKPSKKAS